MPIIRISKSINSLKDDETRKDDPHNGSNDASNDQIH